MIELFGGDMTPMGPIDTAVRIGYAQKENDLDTAELVLACGDPRNDQITLNESWARIWDGEESVGMYRFRDIVADENAPGGTITYSLQGAACTLSDKLLIGHHELGGTEYYTRDVLEYVLARQNAAYWQLGTCDFNDQYQYNFEDVTLLEAIMSLREVIATDCAMVFEADGPPPWTMHFVRKSDEAACSLVVGRNAAQIKRSVDGVTVNRLVGRGYGEGDNQLTIASVNDGRDYLDATPGLDAHPELIREGIHVDRRQTDPETLKARMQAILERGKQMRASYTATAYDLYQITRERWDHHRRGDLVLVLDEGLSQAFRTRITVREKRDVDGAPGAVTLTLDSGVKDVAEELNEVLDKIGVQELYSQGATNMYSQQITDSADSSHPLEMSFYVPGNVVRINSCLLRWKLERFRSYATLASAGGGGTKTSQAGGGATVSIPAQTLSTGVTYSGQPMDAEGSAASLTGGPKSYTGESSTSTSSAGNHNHNMTHVHALSGHDHTFTGEGVTYSIAHNHSLAGEGAQATGAIYSGNKSIKVTAKGEVESSGTLWTTGAYGSTGGSSTNATGENGSHSHSFDHVHNMPHVHNIAHEHTIPAMTFELSGHSHDVTIPSHTHELTYGIYEGAKAESLTIRVDGVDVPADEIGEDKEIDAAKYMEKDDDGRIRRGTWHTVEFVPDGLTRLTANLFFQVFIQSRGAGDY